jgi:hypothetical protein
LYILQYFISACTNTGVCVYIFLFRLVIFGCGISQNEKVGCGISMSDSQCTVENFLPLFMAGFSMQNCIIHNSESASDKPISIM